MKPGLMQAFSRALRRRRRLRHFHRHALQDLFAGRGGGAPVPAHLAAELLRVSDASAPEALQRLHSHEQGLTRREAAARLARHGPNLVEHEKPLSAGWHLWHCYRDPFNLLLSALAAVSYLTHDARSAITIAAMVVLSTGIRFVQEHRSSRAAEALKTLVGNRARVLRQGLQTLAISRLVPGDLVQIAAGDMVPADGRVLVARDLFIAQAALTGESAPREKFAAHGAAGAPAAAEGDSGPLSRDNLVFMGTNVVSGSATVLVVHTGERSYFGALAARITAESTLPDTFQRGVNRVSWLLIRFAAVMVPLVLVLNGVTKGDWLQAFLFALSVAVGLTPEMLPMVVTSTLAKGAVNLARRKVIVKRLDAIHHLGAMDVLCTDKTGTLTEDRITLARHVDAFGRPADGVLAHAFLNSRLQTGLSKPIDQAVLEHVQRSGRDAPDAKVRLVDEMPFDFQRRRMSVVVARPGGGHEIICKGALEEMMAVCTQVQQDGGVVPLAGAVQQRAQQAARELLEAGLRVVAVAMRPVPEPQEHYGIADEAGLVLLGYLAFLDAVKPSAAPALQALAAHGVAVKVLSGDSAVVARQVCTDVGLAPGPVLLGAQLERMTDAELASAAAAHQVFAKLEPQHKERLVRALRAQGRVVGFMGDGINDAPALRAADVGISVDSAVDIAKESADIVLLEKSLLVLDEGVREGRATFCNMLKYIRMTTSSNFGNVFSVLVASAFLPFLPMLPLQLLVQNLLYDVAQIGIPFDTVDEDQLRQPLRWDPADIGRFMLWFGPLSSLFDLSAFALMWWGFHASTAAMQTLFQSGWFVIGLLTQTLVVHLIRTPGWPGWRSLPSPVLVASTALIVGFGLWLPMGPLAPRFGLQPLPLAFFPWLALILLAYAAATTLLKRSYVRRYGWQ